MPRYLTIAAVGDKLSNKTNLLLKYTGNSLVGIYEEFLIPRFENNMQNIIVDSISYDILFIDTESDDDYKMLQTEIYRKADCILLVYSVNIRETFSKISSKWCIEVRRWAPLTPIILVGTDIESRNNQSNETISTEEGENLKLLIGAYAFIECSIQNFIGIDDIFIEAVRSTRHKFN